VAAEVQAVGEVLRVESREARKAATRCALPLLRPSPNSALDDAEGNDKVILQPGLAEGRQLYLEMYHFLGQFIGMALRSKVAIKVNVPSYFWKGLVGEPLDASVDLRAFDASAADLVERVRYLALAHAAALDRMATHRAAGVESAVCAEAVEAAEEELGAALAGVTWQATVSGGDLADLRPVSPDQPVAVEDALAWASALEWCRLHEADAALFAVRDGLASLVPSAVLPLLCGHDLELAVCGRYDMDLALLAANTEYDDDVPPDSEHVRRLWRVLETFDHDERAAFLRFVWARSRLPSAADFNQKFKLQSAVGEGPKHKPDEWLPKAHTCFFSLNLPRYSSDAVMAKQLRYAIFNCIEMDADFKLADNEMTGWDEADDVDEPL
jgi:hypothetical protein